MNRDFKSTRRVVNLFYFIQGINFATWASRIPDIKSALSLDEATLGSVLFAIPIGQMCAMALSAWVIKRIESINALTLAAIIAPLALLPIALSTTTWMLALSLFFFGAATNLFNISVNTQGVDLERIYSKKLMSSLHGMWSLGGFSGGLLSMALTAVGVGTLGNFAIICVASIVADLTFRSGLIAKDIRPEGNSSSQDSTAKSSPFKRLDPYIMMLGIMAFASMVSEGVMFDWSGVFFAEVVNAPENLVKLGYIVCMCAMTSGRFISDRVQNRFGTATVMCFSGLFIFAGLVISAALPTLLFCSIGFFIAGFGISSTVPICYSLAGQSKTLSPSVALATVSTVGYLGFLIGPPIIGYMAQMISLRWTFAILSAIGVVIALLSRRLRAK